MEVIRDKEKAARQWKRYYAEHREYLCARSREYARKNKEKVKARVSQYVQTPKGRYKTYKSSAKSLGRKFELSFEEFMVYWDGLCYYCGLHLDGIGLDRIDSSKDYVEGNIVGCCFFCNGMKSDHNERDFIERCNLIANNHPTW